MRQKPSAVNISYVYFTGVIVTVQFGIRSNKPRCIYVAKKALGARV